MTKITKRKRPILVNGRLKREGREYFEVAYWDGAYWQYKEFDTKEEVLNFKSKLPSTL